ncbi:MAG: TolB family protein [Archangium sp.]
MSRLLLAMALFSFPMFAGCTCEQRLRNVPPPEELPDAGPPPNPELCNGVDDDGDGQIDEEFATVSCGVGACLREMPGCTNGAPTQCMPFEPGTETCNGIDDDCDGTTDEALMPEMCGVGECATVASTCVDGAPVACMPTAGSAEICNGKDDDCDGTVDEDLLANTSGDLRITENPAPSDYVYMGKGQAGFGVVWQDKRDGAEGQIYFTGVTANGARANGSDQRVSNTNGSSVHPALAWSGSNWGLVYADDTSGNFELYFRKLNPNGAPAAAAVKLTTANGRTDWPDLVWTGSNYAVAYDDDRAGSQKHDIYFQRLDANGTRLGGEIKVTTDPGRQSSPILKWNGTNFGLAWTDYRHGSNNREIYFRRLNSDGSPLGGEVRITNSAEDSAWPDLAWNDEDHEWALVWHDSRDGNQEIYFTRVASDGARLGGDVRLTNAAAASTYASIDWNGFQYGVSWQDQRTGKWGIYFAPVSAQGVKNGTDLRLSSGNGDAEFTTALWNGVTFAFGWRDSRNTPTDNTEVYFALVGCLP